MTAPYLQRRRAQMTEAARSGKQNIAEGTANAQQKPKSERYLLSIASASLKELLEDYKDYLRQRGLPTWGKDDVDAARVRQIAYKTDKTYASYKPYMDNPTKAANAMICLINQTTYMIDQQLRAIERQWDERGLIHETHEQRIKRIWDEERKQEEKFWKDMEEQYGIRRTDRDDRTDMSNKTDRADMTDKTNKTDMVDTTDRSDMSVDTGGTDPPSPEGYGRAGKSDKSDTTDPPSPEGYGAASPPSLDGFGGVSKTDRI
ncbi:MAG: hypothetical protein WC749_03095 [Dehalococcoidia bacterium]